MTQGEAPREEDTLIFSYFRVIFWGFKILIFNMFRGFQKNGYFYGYEDFVDIFGVHHKNWTIFSGHFYAF